MDLAQSPVTLTIVIATVAVTIVSFKNTALYVRLMFSVRGALDYNEFWRFATVALVHADYMHLAGNMFTLFFFGSWLEHVMASWRYGLTYLLGAVVGSFVSLVVHRHSLDYRAVGASGAVSAIVGAATLAEPNLSMIIWPMPIPLPAWLAGALYIIVSIVGTGNRYDNIGHEAHLGGMVAGMGMILAFYPGIIEDRLPYIGIMIIAGAIGWFIARRR
ncbi:MAG TPA: rhomboid family intramembrane serine protease [Chlorobiota bacterium]|nr:rhomboid family intramembrane serine protease [Chlorobiota bacterium]